MAKKQRLEIGNDIVNFGGEIESNFDFEDSFESDRRHQEAISDEFTKLSKYNVLTSDVFCENAEKLAYDIHIQRADAIFVNLTGRFVFADFITFLIRVNKLDVEELTITSLSGSEQIFLMFEGLIENCGVKKVNLLLSKYYLRTEKIKHTNTVNCLEQICQRKKEQFNVFYADLHAKNCLIRTKNGGFVSILGSANLKSSKNIEQMQIFENKQIYDFNYNFFKNLI